MLQSFISNLFSNRDATGPGVTDGNPQSSSLEAGGATRGDGRVSFGFSLLRGKRTTMEDFYDAQFKRHQNGEEVGFFGVFDGHGGADAANYVRLNLFNNVLNNPNFTSNPGKAVDEAYAETDRRYLEDQGASRDDGCTAVTALIIGRNLFVANVGDSRAVLCQDGKALQLTEDHKPNNTGEKERIESLGGMVVWAGTWRVGGVLAVSRAFGDRPLKKFVTADPYSCSQQLASNDEFLILASDGVWDVLSNEEAALLVRDIRNPQKAAARLADTALNRGSNDNISCVVIRFEF